MRSYLVTFLLCAAAGCSVGANPTINTKTFQGTLPVKVVATTGMVGDLVRNIGGPNVQVTDLFKPGVDPHTHRASTDDLRRLQSADIVFYNGLHLEGVMGNVLAQLNDRTPSIGIGDFLTTWRIPNEKTADIPSRDRVYRLGWLLRDGEHPDPHIWFDVRLWSLAAENVVEKLAAFDPVRADEYRERGLEYRARLDKLDRETAEQLATIPKDKRVLITSHDAFRYFGRAYDVEVRGIQGVSTETEASVGHITQLVDFLVKSQVKAVFVESSVNPRNMQTLIEGCQARGHTVRQGGELFSDAMGDADTPEGTYEGMIRHNVKTVVEALK
jgi:manganese/zinc/iron transport system substrate-binding protein